MVKMQMILSIINDVMLKNLKLKTFNNIQTNVSFSKDVGELKGLITIKIE